VSRHTVAGAYAFDDSRVASLPNCRLGQASGRRVPTERGRQIATLHRTRYGIFTAADVHEYLGL